MEHIASCALYHVSYHIVVWAYRFSPSRAWCKKTCSQVIEVKVQFWGPELYKKKGRLFQEESYLPRIFRSSSLNLHTFHLIHIVFWWQIFFRKHGKSTPNDREDHHVLVVNIVIMMSQCRCTRALKPITRCKAWQPRAGSAVDRFWTGCHVDAMAAVWQNHIGKNIKITFKLRPSIHNCIANLFREAWKYEVGTILLEIVPPF